METYYRFNVFTCYFGIGIDPAIKPFISTKQARIQASRGQPEQAFGLCGE